MSGKKHHRFPLRQWIQRHRATEEQGSSLVLVMLFMVLLGSLLAAMVTGTQSLLMLSSHSQSFHAANAALAAGIEDYLYRVNHNPYYTLYANTPASFCPYVASTTNVDTSNPYMASSTPVALAGQSSASAADTPKVNYRVDVSKVCSDGYITVSVTAKVGQLTKKMNYMLRKKGFTDFMYFTDYEAIDPHRYPEFLANKFSPNTVENILDICQRHHYEASTSGLPAPRPEYALYGADPAGNSPPCGSVNWGTGESISGEIHTNDALFICGTPVFNGKVTTSWEGSGGQHWIGNNFPSCSGTNNPDFAANRDNDYCGGGNDACYDLPLFLPDNNQQLVSIPGTCVYNGPTAIETLNTGQVSVRSPYTAFTSRCGGGDSYVTINVPNSGVMYVRDIPVTVDTSQPAPLPISQSQADSLAGACSVAPTGQTINKVGYPVLDTGSGKYDITNYGCYDGDAFVSGGFQGRLTIASENRLVITGNMTNSNDSETPVGLIGNRGVEIYHPVIAHDDGTYSNFEPPVNTLDAAILAVKNTFTIQNFDKGDFMGQLYVWGSVAQQWRGSVGTLGNHSGYTKRYEYAKVLKYSSPPNFLTPSNTEWGIVRRDIQ